MTDKISGTIFVTFTFDPIRPIPTIPSIGLTRSISGGRNFFQDALSKFDDITGWDHQLIRVYWYYAENITPWSPNVWRAQRIVDDYGMRMPELTTELVIQKAQDWYEHEFRRFHQLRKSVFEEIQQNTNFLEFKYVGQYVVQPSGPTASNTITTATSTSRGHRSVKRVLTSGSPWT